MVANKINKLSLKTLNIMVKYDEFTAEDLQMECVGKDWLAEAIAPFVANGCSILLSYHEGCGYSIYAKGNIPNEYKV
ncbi:hypothetical protein PRLR5107_15690 [Prevotella lacticifex]|uniref:Uncharacterized protein n=2 Tax=Prevotella lacticifex TaxID=2854755 RepID=A0A9R1CAH4_9BACT|nr:hypothetical protein PRLR5003_10120 [Prevotella lacticifex]GJG39096.1 hypothetical protein PRLR5019_10670 [Prevotella lacticifex]GJG42224.1 hypothetical protein PRLR5025_10100 [Prevotella lacticifex]GJG45450.1 hypothetical protein PRLR5027_10450 [Prevotella lacticifex]GJG48575.1 hypothetical protein PRLR5052_09880 [Prevotella lacticifex]